MNEKRPATIDDILNITLEKDTKANNFYLRFENSSFQDISVSQAAQFLVAQEQLKQLKASN